MQPKYFLHVTSVKIVITHYFILSYHFDTNRLDKLRLHHLAKCYPFSHIQSCPIVSSTRGGKQIPTRGDFSKQESSPEPL